MGSNTKEDWQQIIRSLVISSKNDLTFKQLETDVKLLESVKYVPFAQFGYRNFQDMVSQTPGVKVHQRNGEYLVRVQPTEDTKHIADMVRSQKPAKKKSRKIPKSRPYRPVLHINNRYTPPQRPTQARPPPRPEKKMAPRPDNYGSPAPTRQLYNAPNVGRASTPQKMPPAPPPTPVTPTPQDRLKFAPQKTVQGNGQNITVSFSNNNNNILKPPVTPTPQDRLKIAPHKTVQGNGQNITASLSSNNNILKPQLTPQERLANATKQTASPIKLQIKPEIRPEVRREVASEVRPKIKPIIKFSDPRLELLAYTNSHKLADPKYTISKTKTRTQEIYCCVSIDDIKHKKWSTYPNASRTNEDAEKLAATLALQELKSKKDLPITKNINLVIQRVVGIVNNYSNGIFENKLHEQYSQKFQEELPDHWISTLSSYVNVETFANAKLLRSRNEKGYDNKKPDPVVLPTQLSKLDLQTLGEDFWIYVNVAYNTTDFWGIVIGEQYSDKLADLAIRMKNNYERVKVIPNVIKAGSYYAYFEDDWHRVRCINYNKNSNQATVFFVDRGDEDTIQGTDLFTLESEFFDLPAQSFRISMEGLEDFRDLEEIQPFLFDILVDKEIAISNPKIEGYAAETVLTAQLFADIPNGEPLNINKLVLDEICKIMASDNYLKPNSATTQARISYVGLEGTQLCVYVQLEKKGFQYLKSIMKKINESSKVESIHPGQICAVKHNEEYCRVKIIGSSPNKKVKVLLIDWGWNIEVERNSLISLDHLTQILEKYPIQAHRVVLHKIPFDSDQHVVQRLRELAPPQEIIYLKSIDKKRYPVVQIFKRMENNVVASVNDTLILETEIRSDTTKENTSNQKRSNRSSFGERLIPVPPPNIPQVNREFDIHVTMAANPGHFTVQPHESQINLNDMMVRLNSHCESDKKNLTLLKPDQIKVGQMCAAKYSDDVWYRAYVANIVQADILIVYFVDYGDYRSLTIDKLKFLPKQFYELPYQAIKAKLAGIVPSLEDWSVDDCVKFNDLVVGKNFVSRIKQKTINEITGETVLELDLIDTSLPNQDIDISEELIRVGCAVKA